MIIIYSFNKRGFEADYWAREIAGASDERYTFVPFNHDPYLGYSRYSRAQLLDNLYFERNPDLMLMYADLVSLIRQRGADAMIADNFFPYHPEFLRTLNVFKVLRTSDGPLAAYDRDFAYVHAYDMVLYHTPAYSPDIDMKAKLQYIGARDARLWMLGLFDQMFDHRKDASTILAHDRDIDVIFVGGMFVNKMPLLAKVKKKFGRRFQLHGLTSWKRNLYFNAKHGFPAWVRPISFQQYVPLYQRAKIGINVHNRGDYTVGGYRLFELPANGVMQISDGGEYLESFYKEGEEVVGHSGAADDLIDKISYYLEHAEERNRIALAGYHRVMRDHRMRKRLLEGAEMIEDGMRQKAQRGQAAAFNGGAFRQDDRDKV